MGTGCRRITGAALPERADRTPGFHRLWQVGQEQPVNQMKIDGRKPSRRWNHDWRVVALQERQKDANGPTSGTRPCSVVECLVLQIVVVVGGGGGGGGGGTLGFPSVERACGTGSNKREIKPTRRLPSEHPNGDSSSSSSSSSPTCWSYVVPIQTKLHGGSQADSIEGTSKDLDMVRPTTCFHRFPHP